MKATLLAFLILTSMSFAAHAEDFCIGEKVVLTISGSHYDVSIRQIYQDGTANVEFANGNSSTYKISSLSHARQYANGMSVNQPVILTLSGSHYNVTIREIFADDTALVEFANGNSSTYQISSLSLSLRTLDGLYVNQKAVLTLSGSHYDVVIKQIYQDRKVLVEFANGNSSTYDISDLSRPRRSAEGLHINEPVVLTLSGSHYDVVIREIYQDGKVLVEFANGNSSTYDISSLSRALPSLNGIRVNDNVVLTLSGSHYNVKVKEIFQDGKVLVEFENGNSSTYDISNLSSSVICTSTRDCGIRG